MGSFRWAIFLLTAWLLQIQVVKVDSTSLGFLIEKDEIQVATTLITQPVNIVYKIDFTLEKAAEIVAQLKANLQLFKEKPVFASGSPIENYKNFAYQAENDFIQVGYSLNQIFAMLPNTTLLPPTGCTFDAHTLDNATLHSGIAILTENLARIDNSWTGSAVINDAEIGRAHV